MSEATGEDMEKQHLKLLTIIVIEIEVQLSKRGAARLQNAMHCRASDIRTSAECGQSMSRFACQGPLQKRPIPIAAIIHIQGGEAMLLPAAAPTRQLPSIELYLQPSQVGNPVNEQYDLSQRCLPNSYNTRDSTVLKRDNTAKHWGRRSGS